MEAPPVERRLAAILAADVESEEGKDDALEGAVEHEIVDRLMEDLSRSRKRRLR